MTDWMWCFENPKEAAAEIERLTALVAPSKVDKAALQVAAKKLRKLRLEDVGGRKERPAETVASVFERGWRDTGSVEAQEYILRHGLKYYFAALAR